MSNNNENRLAAGPLAGFTFIEMAGLGPVPLAALILAEMGARVVRIERPGKGGTFIPKPDAFNLDRHGREILHVDLKHPEGIALMLRLIGKADALLEGFRPGVMERLGLGPDAALAANPGLVYGRMTGFGQNGPLAMRAGHDLTYLALTGVLHAIGPQDGKPVPPLNLVADYGGGAMFLISGVLAALLERSRTSQGQVVDAAMVDGASMLAAPLFAMFGSGFWKDERGSNLLDTGCPFYDTYACADGRHVAVACLEPQFFAEFARLLPLAPELATRQYDTTIWPQLRDAISKRLMERPRDAWAELFADTDACVAPVLSLKEAPEHAHNRARQTHLRIGPLTRPAPAPRFSRTSTQPATEPCLDPAQSLAAFGLDSAEIQRLEAEGIVGR